MDNKQLKELQETSDVVFAITKSLAYLGSQIEHTLSKVKPKNELELHLDVNVIHFNFINNFDDATKYIPTLGSEHAAAFDLRACCRDIETSTFGTELELHINRLETKVISTNLKVEIPIGYELIIVPRSGLASKGIIAQMGTIDADYRGELKIIITNLSNEYFVVKDNDRIAQCKLKKVENTAWQWKDKLSDTTRGSGGLGSTGIK